MLVAARVGPPAPARRRLFENASHFCPSFPPSFLTPAVSQEFSHKIYDFDCIRSRLLLHTPLLTRIRFLFKMCASVVLAVFCALLRWLCRLDGRLVRAAATIVGVFAVASSIGYDPEFVTDLFGAFVLIFLLFCVSHHLLSGRVRHPPVAQIPLGVCYVFFGAVFATVMLLGTGNVGMLTSVLDILLIEGSIRQALGSEYAKLSAEYARQVDTIGTLRESLLASCIEFTALCRTRNGGMGRPLRPLSDYLAVHRDIEWKETRLDLVYHLCKLLLSFLNPPSLPTQWWLRRIVVFIITTPTLHHHRRPFHPHHPTPYSSNVLVRMN